MARFLNRATQILDYTFNFVGGLSGLDRIDLSGDIQPVFDLSKASAYARGAEFGTTGGFIGDRLVFGHAGAGDLFDTIDDVYGAMSALLGIPVDGIWVWIMNVGAFCTLDTITDQQVTVQDDGLENQNTPVMLLGLWDVTGPPVELGGNLCLSNSTGQASQMQLPYLLTPTTGTGQALQGVSRATGATTSITAVRFWVGPRYANPPGI